MENNLQQYKTTAIDDFIENNKVENCILLIIVIRSIFLLLFSKY